MKKQLSASGILKGSFMLMVRRLPHLLTMFALAYVVFIAVDLVLVMPLQTAGSVDQTMAELTTGQLLKGCASSIVFAPYFVVVFRMAVPGAPEQVRPGLTMDKTVQSVVLLNLALTAASFMLDRLDLGLLVILIMPIYWVQAAIIASTDRASWSLMATALSRPGRIIALMFLYVLWFVPITVLFGVVVDQVWGIANFKTWQASANLSLRLIGHAVSFPLVWLTATSLAAAIAYSAPWLLEREGDRQA